MTQGRAAAALSTSNPRQSGWFYGWMAIAILVMSVIGFAPSLLPDALRKSAVTPLVTVHGFVATLWLAILFAQTLLVESRKITLHRTLGLASSVVAVAFVVLSFALAVALGRRGFDLSGDLGAARDPLQAMMFPMFDALAFTVLVSAGYLYRRSKEVHKRLMLLAASGAMVPAPITHFTGHFAMLRAHDPLPTVILIAIFIFANAIYDRVTLDRFDPVSLWGAVFFFFIENFLAGVVGPSAAWHRFAERLIA